MAALRLDGIFPEINETGIMPGLFEMEGQIGIVFQGNNDAFFISFLERPFPFCPNLPAR